MYITLLTLLMYQSLAEPIGTVVGGPPVFKLAGNPRTPSTSPHHQLHHLSTHHLCQLNVPQESHGDDGSSSGTKLGSVAI